MTEKLTVSHQTLLARKIAESVYKKPFNRNGLIFNGLYLTLVEAVISIWREAHPLLYTCLKCCSNRFVNQD